MKRDYRFRRLAGSLMMGFLALTMICQGTYAQEREKKNSWGYFFPGFGAATGGGSATGYLHLGGGGEAAFSNGLGVSGEIGYLSPFENFGEGFGVFSVGGLYAIGKARTVPFVGGGYTLFFRSGSANGMYISGGVNRWIGENWGIRIEGRDQIFLQGETAHLLEVRFAIIGG